jgi:small-conductance mechanosensitive channel
MRSVGWMILLLAQLLLPGLLRAAADAPGGSAPSGEIEPLADVRVGGAPAVLEIANRPITTFRAAIFGAEPAARAQAVAERVSALVESGGPLVVSTRPIADGAAVLIDDRIAFRVLKEDLDPDATDTPLTAANLAAQHLEVALAEMGEARDARALVPAAASALAATAVAIGLLWLLARLQRWLALRTQQLLLRKTEGLAPGFAISRTGVLALVTVPIRLLIWLVALLIVYEYVGLVLGLFPYTRPWGETLQGNLISALGRFGSSALHALPGLLFVVLIFLVARLIVRVVRAFFAAVQARRVELNWVDENTARPTERLATVAIWLFALVAAYPYIPGSDSEAFKGIGVFVGLMLSIGSSGVVNQAVSGLMLMYTRTLKPGEFVRIGEVEGTVSSIGFLTTRLETLRREEVNIPNSLITSSQTHNYSRLSGSGHLRIGTQVTIGYDTPWRQVRAMLLEAARRTHGVVSDPAPRVDQAGLREFYVEYVLLIAIAEPPRRALILSELHGHIQDVFNEHGVQIMSPNYEADPAEPKLVRRDDWYRAPAESETSDANSPAVRDHSQAT